MRTISSSTLAAGRDEPVNLGLAAIAVAASDTWIAALRARRILETRGAVFGEDNGPVSHLSCIRVDDGRGAMDRRGRARRPRAGPVAPSIAFSTSGDPARPEFDRQLPPRENELTGNSRGEHPQCPVPVRRRRDSELLPILNPINEFYLSVIDFVLGTNLLAFQQRGDWRTAPD